MGIPGELGAPPEVESKTISIPSLPAKPLRQGWGWSGETRTSAAPTSSHPHPSNRQQSLAPALPGPAERRGQRARHLMRFCSPVAWARSWST